MSTAVRTYSRGRKLVAMRDVQAGTSRYYHYDHQGTTQCLTDGAGNVTDRFASDAWGVPVKRIGNSSNRHWYIGGAGYFRRNGLTATYVRRRWYEPMAASWASSDPLGGVGGSKLAFSEELRFSTYAYVRNRPPLLTDPSGLLPFGSCVKSPPIPELAGAPKCRRLCGPEVGHVLRDTLYDVLQAWRGWDDNRKGNSCLSLTNFGAIPDRRRGFWDAWDIEGLFGPQTEELLLRHHYSKGCATHPDCRCTVMVFGQCHRPWAVNYVFLGWIWEICRTAMPLWVYPFLARRDAIAQREEDYSEARLKLIVHDWQNALSRANPTDYSPSDATTKTEWALAGFKYWATDPRGRTPSGMRGCKYCSKEKSSLGWRWNRWNLDE